MKKKMKKKKRIGKYKYICKKHGYIYGHKNREVLLIGGNKMLP